MTEQPTTPQPDRPLPRLGHGVHWPAIVAKIDKDGGPIPLHPDAETRRLLGERVPQTFTPTVGRGDLRQYPLADDEQPATVPARPYGDAIECGCADCRRAVPIADLIRAAPATFVVNQPGWYQLEIGPGVNRSGPPAAELRALADDLNTHGGLDEEFVAALLRAAADPLADAKHGLGIVDPPPPVTATKPPPSFVDAIAKACDDALRVPLPAPIVVHPAHYDTFKELLTPRPLFAGTVPHDPPDCAAGRHIWSATSPMRCVECRRYLRPWWRRALDRARRWGR